MTSITSLDLFSGIGGMTLKLPIKTQMYCENDPFARSILEKRMKNGDLTKAPIHTDIRTLDNPPNVDIICAGFPCQDISVIGHQKAFEGKKSILFFEIVRLIDKVNPQLVYLENVNHILNMPSVWKPVLHSLASRGYDISWTVIGACNVNIPQRRLRWFCLAKKKRNPVEINESFLECYGKKMFKNGAIVNGKYIEVKTPELEDYKLPKPIVLQRLRGVQCNGKILNKNVKLWRWATPRAYTAIRACRNLTARSTRDLPSQHRFEKKTKPRYMMSNPTWIEWLMGFPKNWTNIEEETVEEFKSTTTEPNVHRMVEENTNHLKDRCRVLGNACVPACSELAWNILQNRFKYKSLLKKRKRT